MLGPSLAELKRCIERFTGRDGVHPTAIAPLSLLHLSATSEPVQGVYEPSLCTVAQGSKRIVLADEVYHHDAGHFGRGVGGVPGGL
jgi:AraC-type transcriptional regulator N-terminus